VQHSRPVKSARNCARSVYRVNSCGNTDAVIQRSTPPCRSESESVRNSIILHRPAPPSERNRASQFVPCRLAKARHCINFFQSSGGSRPIALTADTRAEDANQFLEAGIRAGATARRTDGRPILRSSLTSQLKAMVRIS
jgi:hypothetical protein